MSEMLKDKMLQHEDWRILAEKAAHEQDPEKLIEIIKALTCVLDEKGRLQYSRMDCDARETSNHRQ